jgi:hypothetical protein
VFYCSEGSFELWPGDRGNETVKTIPRNLIYLGTETFYFAKDEISKPVFPPASEKKERAIETFKQGMIDYMDGFEKGEYRIGIEEFNNIDKQSHVVIIKEDGRIWDNIIYYGINEETKEGEAEFQWAIRLYTEPTQHDYDLMKAFAEKIMELSVCDLTITIPDLLNRMVSFEKELLPIL